MTVRAKAAAAVVAAVVSIGFMAGCTSRQSDFVTPNPGPGGGPVVERAAGADARAVLESFRDRSMVDHLEALQRIADDNDGNRASGTSGYGRSARYVEEQLRAAGYTPVRQEFTYRRDGERVETFNILADMEGSAGSTVVVGAHLDSVQGGPGINDNGSGVAAVLETARWMRETGIKPTNRVRFAFWGAEEDDLDGSRHYLDELSAAEVRRTAVYLNVDMLASPNGVRSFHDGDGSDFGHAGPAGSQEIEDVFFRYFKENSLPAETTGLAGGSDYEPFVKAGIPSGGLFSGDVESKTRAQVRAYGGVAGKQLDPCYHKPCDTIRNINLELLREMSGALAYATVSFALAGQG